MTDEGLQALCAEWQAILRIQDWDIAVECVRAREIDGDLGCADIYAPKRMARVQIARVEDVPPDCAHIDPETTLVHELLHILLPHEDDEARKTAQEQAIHAISCSLVKLKRGG